MKVPPNKLQPEYIKTWGVIALPLIIIIHAKVFPGKVFTLRGGALNINILGAALFFRENRRTAELFLFVI